MSRVQRAPKALVQTIDELVHLPKDQLRNRWTEAFQIRVPSHASRTFLERSLAYRIQEQTLGGLSARLNKRLASLQKELERDPGFAPAPTPSFKPGTRLIRQWKGEVHEVEVLETGFSWGGEHYSNLSRIARAITGTRWSGPVFFGLKKRPQKEPDHAP
jgi:hypothetical protein